eukprot:TRINITY_DN704_c1_g1_i1.p1 TRINITY_DN704_c1_g1~~TRINITY_DN704_c1_g1_i1.p1  ORF type:complete len:1493 (-),score=434.68 TRINITY_DN704_c1_g1_i1:288-4766(-)
MEGALGGLIFTLHGFATADKKRITELVQNHGGQVVYVGKNITHMITTPEELQTNGYKIQSAKSNRIEVVLEEFLHEKTKNAVPVQIRRPETPKEAGAPAIVRFVEDEVTTAVKIPALPPNSTAPSVNLLLPNYGPCEGRFSVAIFGINFQPNTKFQLKFGSFVCTEVEFHCSTALVANISAVGFPPGEVLVMASNDGGKHYGPATSFRFYDVNNELRPSNTSTENVSIIQSQLQNVRRSIVQLQMGVINVQRLELELRSKVDHIDLSPIADELTFHEGEEARGDHDVQRALPADKGRAQHHTKEHSHVEKQIIKLKKEDGDREVRIFISSPFRDMQDERNSIVKRVIPRLRKLCSDRDLAFSYVDLRWGVTGIQNEQAATLLMCLREIEKSNIFIGMYGERYGWCLSQNGFRNPSNQDELLKRSIDIAKKEFPWISDFKDRSVSEIEMRTVLSHSVGTKASFFYFRDPYYIESIAEDKKHLYKSEGEYEAAKLGQLKEDIIASPYPYREFADHQKLEDLLYEDLAFYINQNYPKGSELSPLENERFRHTAFAKSVTRVYLPTEKNFVALDRFASQSGSTPLILLGESGVGKSALLASWCKRYKEHHPEDTVISHFIGCSPSSTNYVETLSRIMFEVQDQLGDFQSEPPSDPKEIIAIFPGWLDKILARNKKHRLILAIDALDNLDDREKATDLVWLPQSFPSLVRVVISAAPSHCYDVLHRRGYETFALERLGEPERFAFIRGYLNLSSKKLNEEQEFLIAGSPHSGNARYLKTLLEDISVFGEFEELTTKIKRNLRAQSASELYEIVLARLESDYDSEKEIIKNFMSLIWASRRGLNLENELAIILEENFRIEHHEWSPVFVVLEELLFTSGGLISFSNRDIRAAVENKYLDSASMKREYHRHLATFFSSNIEGVTERKIEELPYQLEQAAEFEKLKTCISDLRVFDKLYHPEHKFDLFRYWRSITSALKSDPVKSYTDALNYTDQFPSGEVVADVFYRVGYFLEEIGKFDGAAAVYTKARYHYEASTQNLEVANMDYVLGRVLLAQARYREAEERLKSAMKVYAREKGDEAVEITSVIYRLAGLYAELGRISEAEENFLKALRLREAKYGPSHSRVAQVLKAMLTFYEERGNYVKAAEHGERALKITEEMCGPDDIQVFLILVRLGRLYMSQKKYKQSKQILKRAMVIVENKLGKDHHKIGDVLYELGCLYFVKPEEIGKNPEKAWSSDKSEQLFLKALKLKENAFGATHPDIARISNRLGSLYIEKVEFPKAEAFLKRSLKIREEVLGNMHARVSQSLRTMLTLFEVQEQFTQAVECGKKALRIEERLKGPESPTVVNIIIRLGQLYFLIDGQDSYEGKKHLEKAIELKENKLGKDAAEVRELRKLLDELEHPNAASYAASTPVTPIVVAEPIKVIKEIVIAEGEIPPPPPPPAALPPPPPPPPGAAPVAAKSQKPLNEEIKMRNVACLKKAEVKQKGEGWWKQNYHYN